MEYEIIIHRAENLYQKLHYIYEHSGDSSLVHEAGTHSSIVINYLNLVKKEYNNPIMRSSGITWETYANKLQAYFIKAEAFLYNLAVTKTKMEV